jgi:hypothetical protein
VDVHGNESKFSLLPPVGALDAAGAGVPAALSSSAPAPNPAPRGAQFRFALPADGRVVMMLFDQQGRRVRDLAYGSMTAGEHAV